MAYIDRKAYYVGTWRDNVVSDTVMRQIIARSHAEKGQKVKVKLSKDGIVLIKTVMFQETVMHSFPLRDVYFLTVNQRHPSCLLCIVADPVKKYLILVLRTVNEVEAQEIINTFKELKDNPDINGGNVVLRRKDNGNWTLRERSQHNANRHLLQIFRESAPDIDIDSQSQPNGHPATPVPSLNVSRRYLKVGDGGSQLGDYTEGQVIANDMEVENLSQELQEVKFVVEKTGSVSSATIRSRRPYNVREISVTNGDVISDPRDEAVYYARRPGEARVAVEDYRNSNGMVRAYSSGSHLTVPDGSERGQRRIAVPEPTVTNIPTVSVTPDPDDWEDIPSYTVHRSVSREYVPIPGQVHHRYSTADSVRSMKVKFGQKAFRRIPGHGHREIYFSGSSRGFRVPSTIVRPIEEIYRPAVVKQQTVWVDQHLGDQGGEIMMARPSTNTVFVAEPPAAVAYRHHYLGRRSRPNSVHVMEGNRLRVFHRSDELDDVIL